jgi:cyclase
VSAPHPAEPTLVEVVDGVHAWLQPDGTWWLNNAGAVHHDGSVLVVDTCANRPRTEAMLAAVSQATGDAPVRWAVNTHQHGDHVYGNALLPADTVLVGHENMRAGLRDDFIFDACPPFWTPVPDWGVEHRRLPDVVFDSSFAVHLGDLRVEALHPGYAAHTSGDVVVHLPEQRVLFAGDLLFHGLTPMLLMGSVDGARRSLEWLAALDPAHVVPGHGPLIGPGQLDRVLAEHDRYYRMVADALAAGLAADLGPLEAARAWDLGDLAGWPDSERLVLNLHKAYADHAGVEVDLVAAMQDAMVWNDGPMHTGL